MSILPSLYLIIFCVLLLINNVSHAQTYAWTGSVEGDCQNPSNWNPVIAPFEHSLSLVIGAGRPNACMRPAKKLVGGYRPGKLNTLTGGSEESPGCF